MSNTINIPSFLVVATVDTLNNATNILFDKIDKFEQDNGLTFNDKSTLKSLKDKLDTSGYADGENNDGVDYQTAKEHQELLKEVNTAFNLVRNNVAKSKRLSQEKYSVVEAYETLQKLELALNEKDSNGNYLRTRTEDTSPFRVHLDLTFNAMPHKDGSGRTFTHAPQRHTFLKKKSAEFAAKSNPFNVKAYVITDEWEEATKAWKTCRNADSNLVTAEMLELLQETIVVSTLEAGYKLFKSKRGNKKNVDNSTSTPQV